MASASQADLSANPLWLRRAGPLTVALVILAYFIKGGAEGGSPASDISVLAVFALACVAGLALVSGARFRVLRSDVALGVLCAWLTIGIAYSPDPAGGFVKLLRFLLLGALQIPLTRVVLRDRRTIDNTITLVFWSSVALGLAAIASYGLSGLSGGRLHFGSINPIPFSALMSLAWFFGVMRLVDDKGLRLVAHAVGVCVLTAGLAIAGSRGPALLALAVAAGSLARSRSPRALLVTAFLAIVVCALAASAPTALMSRVVTLLSGQDSTGSGRVEIWARAVDMIRSHPIFGVGTAGFGGAAGYPHNTILEFWCENGAIGLGLAVAWLATCWGWNPWPMVDRRAATLWGAMLLTFLHTQLSFSYSNAKFFYFSVGLVMAERSIMTASKAAPKSAGNPRATLQE